MKWLALIILAAGVALSGPVLAQQNTSDLLKRLQSSNPDDLAAAAREAQNEYNLMTPEQRAAAQAAAQAQIPALISGATDWWNKLTPEQQAAYQKSVKGLSGTISAK